MRSPLSLSLAALAAFTISQPAFAEETHRELGAHEHGHGTLNIAIENDAVAMELEAPGMDIVGFEHAAETDAQKSAMATAKSELAKPLALFKLPSAASCNVTGTDVALEAEHEHDDEHEKEADHGHHDEVDADDHDEHEGHTAFHVTYELKCANPASLAAITFDYFKKFAGAQKLTVNVVTDKAQSTFEVSRDKPQLDLTGMM